MESWTVELKKNDKQLIYQQQPQKLQYRTVYKYAMITNKVLRVPHPRQLRFFNWVGGKGPNDGLPFLLTVASIVDVRTNSVRLDMWKSSVQRPG